MLEEGSFRGRTLDFLWMLLLGATSMVLIVPLINSRVHIPFLSSPLTFMLVYIWSRRNPYIKMNFLGLFTFTAPYLPWVLLGFTVLLNNFFPAGDLLGMAVAHVYYFFEDVYPRMDGSNGWRLFQTPKIFKYLLEDIWSSRDPSIADLPANMNNLDNEIVMEDINHPDISLAQDEVPNPNVAVDEKEVVIESNVEVKVTSEFKNAENVSSQIGAESSIRQRHIKEEDLKENLD
ncbi:Derlin-2 [Clydaea vesicula]|uniref:Derlin n=1 Tax=Clydaea vesicula TaxID=447962 RepID=A0AAD5U4E6_9FUNG|nr:Derlin-2 [Clydaea vesicula]